MFNPLRLLRRKDYIDDAATAYIEGRATDRDEVALRDREAREPGLRADVESIRATVSLLRSVEPARAPRSFALTHAPAPVRRSSRPRLAMAPAVFAIAAAATVGLLAVGNLANVVHQSDGTSESSSTANFSADLTVTASGSVEDGVGMQEPEGVPGLPGQPGTASSALFADTARAAATATPAATQATGTAAPLSTSTPFIEETLPVVGPDAPPPDASGGYGIASEGTVPGLERDSGTVIKGLDEPLAATGRIPSDSAEAGERRLRPQATIITVPGDAGGFDLLTLEAGEPQGGSPPTLREPDESGFALPLWQLQVGFAALAVLMAGAWVLLQRRLIS
ncbi:MAG: hypothetical protein O3B04_08970 [Chloroflexi bacterium]|nr:hypothetical protein [Chloroflexota bacterium]